MKRMFVFALLAMSIAGCGEMNSSQNAQPPTPVRSFMNVGETLELTRHIQHDERSHYELEIKEKDGTIGWESVGGINDKDQLTVKEDEKAKTPYIVRGKDIEGTFGDQFANFTLYLPLNANMDAGQVQIGKGTTQKAEMVK